MNIIDVEVRRRTVLKEDLDKFDVETCDKETLYFYQNRKMRAINDKTAPEEDLVKFDFATTENEVLRFYQIREMAIMEFNTCVRVAEEEGFEEGQQEERLEMTKSLKAIGMPIAQISSITGLSPEEIEQLE
jgi:predicted transposase/invertase (TIGR01784 family)